MNAIENTLNWAERSGMGFWHRDFPVEAFVKYNPETGEYIIAQMDTRRTPIAAVSTRAEAEQILASHLASPEAQMNAGAFADNWLSS